MRYKFDKRLKNLPQTIWELLNKIDEIKGQWVGGAELNPQALGRLKKSTLITSSGASTRIEGARLSDGDVEKLMKGLVMQKFADRDKQEVRGYYELLNNVFEAWRHISFSESTIKHFHKELLKYVEKDKLHRGEYKKMENKVFMIDGTGKPIGILFDTTPAYLTPKEMLELTEWTQKTLATKEIHPLLVIGSFLVEFLNIHPFQDGNGRLSRILTNLLMLKNGYPYMPYISHEKLIEDNKADYYIALRRSQKTIKKKKEDITPWLEFFLNIILEQTKQAINLLSKENLEMLLSPKQIDVWFLFNNSETLSTKEIAEKLGNKTPLVTIKQVLSRLVALKLIKKIGQGRTTRYSKI